MYTWIMHSKLRIASALLIVVVMLNPMRSVLAGDDYIQARQLHESGKILPLELILKHVRQIYPGKVLEVELENEDGRIIYEVEILAENGIVKEVYIDAETGKILITKEDD